MRIVLFSRVPRWYSFKNERLASHLAAEGFEIVGIMVEEMRTLKAIREWKKSLGAKVFAEKLGQRIKGKGQNSPTKEQFSKVETNPKVYHFKSHNSSECVERLRELSPDVIVLRGCGILKPAVLDVAKIGVINPHYALLPDFRGMDVTEWSALHGEPIAVSVHSVNAGVDTGTVLKSEIIKPVTDDTVGSLRDKSAALAVRLLREALEDLRDGKPFPVNKMNDGGRQFFKMHPRLKELANERLRLFADKSEHGGKINAKGNTNF